MVITSSYRFVIKLIILFLLKNQEAPKLITFVRLVLVLIKFES